jgi:thiol:disulfide interchange protein DsbD
MNLKVTPESDVNTIEFGEPVFPDSHKYFDKISGKEIDVFSGEFCIFVPFKVSPDINLQKDSKPQLTFTVEGAVCSENQCRMPEYPELTTEVEISQTQMSSPSFEIPQASGDDESKAAAGGTREWSVWFALLVALLAGLLLNIMPCVWPVLPVIVMRIVDQAKKGRKHTISMGLAFCAGIVLFFTCLALANIILQVFYGSVLQWGDQYRNPVFLGAMGGLLVVLALFMFDVFTITLPGSVSGAQTGGGAWGSVGMGFLAAVLSTPCSFAILAAAFAWAQTQPIFIATVTILTIGIGMGIPYFVLVMVPGWLDKIPKPGYWMELFKQGVGFLLLAIAIKLISALPAARRIDMIYYTILLAVCCWIWGKWIRYDSKRMVKILVRGLAILIAVAGGWMLFASEAGEQIDWQQYDAELIEEKTEAGQPVLIKFTADWCLSCKVVDKMVYGDKEVVDLLKSKDVLTVKADTTSRGTPATRALKETYNEPGVPVTVLLLSGKDEPIRWKNLDFAEQLKERLESLEDGEK